MSYDDYLAAHSKYDVKRGQIHVDAYDELIQLVRKHGNRRLKDQMWALVDRTRAKTAAALDELKAATNPTAVEARQAVTR